MSGYSPGVEDGWTAPSEQGYSADLSNEAVEQPDVEAHEESTHDALDESYSNRPKKKKNAFQKRIDQLMYEKGAVEQNNTFLAQQLAEKDAYLSQQQARLHQFEEQINEKNDNANEYFENSLDVHERSLKDKFRKAKEDGDIEDELHIIDQIAEIKATKASHAAWKVQEEARKQKELYEEDYEPYSTHLPNMPYQNQSPQDIEFQSWANQNQWYSNPNLKAEADSIASELSNVLLFNNQGHMIGTPEFRESVTNVMSEKYGIGMPVQQHQQQHDYEEEEPQGYSSYQSRPAVAPVTRRSAPTMAQNYMSQRSTQRPGASLTKEEYDLARHLQPRRNESEVDLIKRYQKGKAYPRSPLQGGSPNRLTIL
jgi:hypothetical protein